MFVFATRTAEVVATLNSSRVDLFVVSLDGLGDDVLDMLVHLKRRGRSPFRTLVMTYQRGVRMLVTLRRLEVTGVFNPREEPLERLTAVLTALESGNGYWGQGSISALVSNEAFMVIRQMPPPEQLALAMMGDGCSDKTATERLGMSLSSVRSLRKELHARLNVHDREGLQRTAARLGFTRASEDGTVPMGAAMLVLEYMERSKRPVALPTYVLQQCGFFSDEYRFGSTPPFERAG